MPSVINATTTNGVTVQGDNSGSLQLATNNGTTALTIDTSQNVGIGTTPNIWNSSVKAVQVTSAATFFGGAGNASISQNYLYDAANADVYVGNGFATQLLQRNGQFEFYTAPNNTSGALAAMTFTQRMVLTNGGLLQFNSGYGSVATAYGCRAWVNFNGTGTPAIRASGNVSSITDFATGEFGVNFTTAMPDINYAPVATCTHNAGLVGNGYISFRTDPLGTTSSVSFYVQSTAGSFDPLCFALAVFR